MACAKERNSDQVTPARSNGAANSSTRRAANRREQRGQLVARLEPVAFQAEIEPRRRPSSATSACRPVTAQQAAPLAAGQRHDHDPPAVGGREVLAEGAEERVAVFRPVDPVDRDLAQDAEIAQHRQRHVLERDLDQLALAGAGGGGARPRAGQSPPSGR